jgi:hypothetical protein
MRVLWLAVVAMSLSGCATGFDRGILAARASGEPLQVTDDDVLKALQLKPQLAFPCRVAVYLCPDSGCTWRWTARDKETLDRCADTLRAEGIVSDMFVMSDMVVQGTDEKQLRLAAAKHGADALLIVKGAAQIESYVNPLAVLNLTVVGGYFIPGSHRDALFLMHGCLLDVGNGFLYASVESEGEGGIIRPTFLIEDRDAAMIAKRRAVEKFGPELVKRIENLRCGAPSSVILGARPTVPPPAPPPATQPAATLGAVRAAEAD